MITPEQLAKKSEFSHQVAYFCWCGLNLHKYPELRWCHSITNEEKTDSVIVGSRAKQSGRKKGVSDICLPVKRGDYSGLYIEMKRLDKKPKTKRGKGGESKEQREFGTFVQTQGFGYIVCWGWIEARNITIQYLEQKP